MSRSIATHMAFFVLALSLLSVLAPSFAAGDARGRDQSSSSIAPLTYLPLTVQEPPAQQLPVLGHLGGPVRALDLEGPQIVAAIGAELAVLDLTRPVESRRVGWLLLSHITHLLRDGPTVYVTRYDPSTPMPPELAIVSVANPHRPTLVTTLELGHEPRALAVSGETLYIASDGGGAVIDVSVPAAPVVVGPIDTDPRARITDVALGTSSDLFVSFRYPMPCCPNEMGIRRYSLADPQQPSPMAELLTPAEIRHIETHGGLMVAIIDLEAIVVFDITSPTPLSEIGRFTTRLYPLDLDLDVGWGLISVSGLLQAVDLRDPAAPRIVWSELGQYGVLDLQGYAAVVAHEPGGLDVLGYDPLLGVVPVSELPIPHEILDVALHNSTAILAARGAGLVAADLTDPLRPAPLSRLDTPGNAWDVAVEGDYAYVADEFGGLRVIALDAVPDLREVGALDTPRLSEFFHGIAVRDGIAYVADGSILPADNGLRLIDVTDPTDPREIAFVPLPERVEDVEVVGSYAYVAGGPAGLRIVDVTDPANPREVGALDTPGRSEDLAVTGSLVLLADGDLRLIDVSDPAAPREIGFFDLPGDTTHALHVAVFGTTAYVGTTTALWTLDISNPSAPIVLETHALARGTYDVVATPDHVLAADGGGLFVLAR